MKTHYTVALAMVAGFGLGAVAIQGLHAQAKAPVYTVTEIDVTNLDAYTKEYGPLAQELIKKSGGKVLAAGQKVTTLEGAPPKPRVAIQQWDSLDAAKAWRNSAEGKSATSMRHSAPSPLRVYRSNDLPGCIPQPIRFLQLPKRAGSGLAPQRNGHAHTLMSA